MLRGDGLLTDVLEGKMLEEKRAGKPREGMISGLKKAISNSKIKKDIMIQRIGQKR